MLLSGINPWAEGYSRREPQISVWCLQPLINSQTSLSAHRWHYASATLSSVSYESSLSHVNRLFLNTHQELSDKHFNTTSSTFHSVHRKPNPVVTSQSVDTISLVLSLTRTSPVVFVLFNVVQPALLKEPNVEVSPRMDSQLLFPPVNRSYYRTQSSR